MWSQGSLIALALSLLTAAPGEAQQPPRPRREQSDQQIERLEREVAQLKRELQRVQNAPRFRGGMPGAAMRRQMALRGARRGAWGGAAFQGFPGRPGFGAAAVRPGQRPFGRPGVAAPRGFGRESVKPNPARGFQKFEQKKPDLKRQREVKPGGEAKQQGAVKRGPERPRPDPRRTPPPGRPRRIAE